jgi:hypothetical protein
MTLALKLRELLPPEIIHDVAESFKLFDPTPSAYERRLAYVQEWFLRQIKARFNMGVPEFKRYVGQLNRAPKGERNRVLDEYREAVEYYGTQLKGDTVQDYFDCGWIREDAENKLLAIFNAQPPKYEPPPTVLLSVLDSHVDAVRTHIKKVGMQYYAQAIAHKQALRPERKKAPRPKVTKIA